MPAALCSIGPSAPLARLEGMRVVMTAIMGTGSPAPNALRGEYRSTGDLPGDSGPVDQMVLDVICEHGLRTGTWQLTPDAIWSALMAPGIQWGDLQAAITRLEGDRLLEIAAVSQPVSALQPTRSGFARYAAGAILDLATVETAIVAAIVRDSLRRRDEIAAAVGQPLFLVDFVLARLQEQNKLKYARPIDHDPWVVLVFPALLQTIAIERGHTGGMMLLMNDQVPPVVGAHAEEAESRPPTCPKCRGRGVTLRGESTFERCDCATGHRLYRVEPAGQSPAAGQSV